MGDVYHGGVLSVSQSIESGDLLVAVQVAPHGLLLRVERAGRISPFGFKARYVACYEGWQLRKVHEYVEILESLSPTGAQEDGTSQVRRDQGPQQSSASDENTIGLTLDDPPAAGLVLLRHSELPTGTDGEPFRGGSMIFSSERAGGTDPIGA